MVQPFYRVLSRIILYFLIISLLLFACAKEEVRYPEYHEENDISDYSRIEEWFEYLCSPSLGGRYSGSPGIDASCEYLCQIIDAGEDSLRVIRFVDNNITFKNIIFHVDGKKDTTIVFGAHYDSYGFKTKTTLPGADDNISGVAVLLCLVDKLKQQQGIPDYCIDICFWDGEEIGRYGSKHYVEKLDEVGYNRMMYINVDTVGSEQYYQVTLSYNVIPLVFNYSFYSFASDLNSPVVEYNPNGFTTDCESFLKKDIPFINISCDRLPPYLHSSSDIASNISFNQINRIANALFDNLIFY